MKIAINPKGSYAEEGQPNPMRWLMLYRNEDGTYESTGAWLKCKDFFNDYCFAYNTGKTFSIWSFNTSSMKIEKKGNPVAMLLDVLTPAFIPNLKEFNTWLKDNGLPQIDFEKQADGKVFVEFDPFYFRNTYYISLVSLIIRLCNDEKYFNSFAELISWKNFPPKDQAKWDQVVKAKYFFNIPEKLRKFIFYCGPEYNSENDKKIGDHNLPSLVHNCGVLTWTKYFT